MKFYSDWECNRITLKDGLKYTDLTLEQAKALRTSLSEAILDYEMLEVSVEEYFKEQASQS